VTSLQRCGTLVSVMNLTPLARTPGVYGRATGLCESSGDLMARSVGGGEKATARIRTLHLSHCLAQSDQLNQVVSRQLSESSAHVRFQARFVWAGERCHDVSSEVSRRRYTNLWTRNGFPAGDDTKEQLWTRRFCWASHSSSNDWSSSDVSRGNTPYM
jgi:hypothetical protein